MGVSKNILQFIMSITGYILQTKVNPCVLAAYLENYLNIEIKNKLISGFTQGFSISCHSKPSLRLPPSNNKNVIQKPDIAQQMMNDEIKLGCMLGPDDTPPLPYLICSLLNLVPKVRDSSKHCLIHNLAHPYDQNRVNSNIPDQEVTLLYLKFDKVVKLALKHGKNAVALKLDYNLAL